jgi:hypothetical protein
MKNLQIPTIQDIREQVRKELIKREKFISIEQIKSVVDLAIRKNNEAFNRQIHKLTMDVGNLERK